MGRRLPAVIIIINPSETLSLAFMCMTITASLAVISSLCGTRFRRKTDTNTSDNVAAATATATATALQSSSAPPAASSPHEFEPQFPTVKPESSVPISIMTDALPPPPSRRHLDSNGSQSMKPKSNVVELSGGRKLSSISMSRVGRSLSSVSMRWSRKDVGGGGISSGNNTTADTSSLAASSGARKMKAKLEKEDSIWMKTIILGEKCRVEDEDDPVIFDDRGFRVKAYHRKVGSSLPVSRSSSFIDSDVIPTKNGNVLVLEKTGEESN